MSDKKSIIDKIEKLLRMANDVSSPNEAAIALRRARYLMDKHQVDSNDFVREDVITDKTTKTGSGKRIPLWISAIAVIIAEFNDCQCQYQRKNNDPKMKMFNFMGYKIDVLVCHQMLSYIYATALRLYKISINKHTDISGLSYRNSYLLGFSRQICNRIKEMMDKRTNNISSKSLIPLKKQMVENKYGVAEYRKKQGSFSSDEAYTKGYIDANNVFLGKQIDNGTKDKLKSAN